MFCKEADEMSIHKVKKQVDAIEDSTLKKDIQDKMDKCRAAAKKNLKLKQLDHYCNDIKDDNRYQTAWFYVNTNVKVTSENADLKKYIVEL
jgi:hypothetical protein